jgi:HlyD family secretion protein
VENGTVTVDVALDGELPRGARPDLTVDGTIELERMDDILFVGRPVFGQEQSVVSRVEAQSRQPGADRVRADAARFARRRRHCRGRRRAGRRCRVPHSHRASWRPGRAAAR